MASAGVASGSAPPPPAPPPGGCSPVTVERTCGETCEKMQLVAELLLLQTGSQPVAIEPVSMGNESYAKSRDAIVANTKGLAISIKDLSKHLRQRNLPAMQLDVEQIGEQVIILTEAATHAAYITALTDVMCKPAKPGLFDRYSLARAQQGVHMAYEKFKPEYGHLSRDEILQISRTFADNLALLSQGCRLAAENQKTSARDRTQLLNCTQCLQGTTAAFLASLKAFASSHSSENRRRCLLFGRPVLAAVDCIIEFTNFPQFGGTPARLTQKGFELQTEILGGAMAVVSSSVQLLTTAKDLLQHTATGEASHWLKIVNCTKAVADATKLLSSSIRQHTPLPSRSPSVDHSFGALIGRKTPMEATAVHS